MDSAITSAQYIYIYILKTVNVYFESYERICDFVFRTLLLSKFESVKIYWLFQWKLTDLTVKNIFFTNSLVKVNWFNSEKYFFTDSSVKNQITDSISENLTDSDLESILLMHKESTLKKIFSSFMPATTLEFDGIGKLVQNTSSTKKNSLH